MAYPFFTNLSAGRLQGRLGAEFGSADFRDNFGKGDIAPGQPLSRIEIKSIALNALMVEGADPKALKAGVGHYPKTALPCEAGNVAIAGHRTTFGRPFHRIDELKPGDTISLSTPKQSCTYRVVVLQSERTRLRPNRQTASWITDPHNTSLLEPLPGSMLTLTTCHPKGSARQRLVVRAEMVSA